MTATAISSLGEVTEVPEKAKRRTYTVEYKLRIVKEADACKGTGDVGALLRREGLYSSQLTMWRQRPSLAFDLAGRLLWCSKQAASALPQIPDEILAAVYHLGEAASDRSAELPTLAVCCRAGEHLPSDYEGSSSTQPGFG